MGQNSLLIEYDDHKRVTCIFQKSNIETVNSYIMFASKKTNSTILLLVITFKQEIDVNTSYLHICFLIQLSNRSVVRASSTTRISLFSIFDHVIVKSGKLCFLFLNIGLSN